MGIGLVGTGWFMYSSFYPRISQITQMERDSWRQAMRLPTLSRSIHGERGTGFARPRASNLHGRVSTMQLCSRKGQVCENHRAGVPAAEQMRMERPARVMAGRSVRRPDLPGGRTGRETPGGDRICGYGILHCGYLLSDQCLPYLRGQYSKRNRLMAIGGLRID